MRKAIGEGRHPGLCINIGASGHPDPDRLEEHQGLVLAEPAFVDVLSVVGVEVLIDAAVADDAADRLLEPRDRLDEPLRLHCFMEGTRRMLGDSLADLGDLQELASALFVSFAARHLSCQRRVAMRKRDHGVAHQQHGLEKRPLLDI